MIKTLILISFYILFCLGKAFPQIIYQDENKNYEITSQIYFYKDATNTLSLKSIIEKDSFILLNNKVPNFGVTSASVWLRLTIQNNTSVQNLILQVNQPIIDQIELYNYDTLLKKYNAITMGELNAFIKRKYQTPDYLFDLSIPRNKSKVFYLKVICKENMQIPLTIGTSVSLFNQSVLGNLFAGTYFGIMLVMILYNLFIYGIFRDKSYLIYCLYILFTTLTQTSLQGYTFQFLWPNYPWLAVYSPFIFPSLVSIAGLEFFKRFLQIKERIPVAYRISLFFLIPYSISIILGFCHFFNVSFLLMEITSSIVSVFMLVISYKIFRMGFQEARFFFLGWLTFLVGVCVYVLKDFEILPYNTFTRYTMHFGSAAEVILLSFALADRINLLKKEKNTSQLQSLKILRENERLITEQKNLLEQKVEERTIALKITNNELQETLSNLKNTQAQLVNAEKMATLGQLTAGIAHEINNPINFVSANIKPLKLDINDLLELIKKYENLDLSDATINEFKIINDFRKEIDIDYLKKEMAALLLGIEDGARRTAEIVAGLKNFSRLDESEVKEVNINEGIESTLILLKSKVPKNTRIILNLGEIPKIECLAGKLNQVFMNLFSNALYAISIKNSKESNTLTISTYTTGTQVCVTIEDTGIGMTSETKKKLFEPFFTTKDVGEGTGLGMSIVFKIIESHGGKIEVKSEYGIGTKILLILNNKISITYSV